jgi:hypothetical protein
VEKTAAETATKKVGSILAEAKPAHKKALLKPRRLAASMRLDSGRRLGPGPQLAAPAEVGSGAEEGEWARGGGSRRRRGHKDKKFAEESLEQDQLFRIILIMLK